MKVGNAEDLGKQVNILGLNYSIKEVDIIEKGEVVLGQINYITQEILIEWIVITKMSS